MSEQLFSGWQQELATVRERSPLLTYEVQGKECHVRDTSNLSGKGRPTLILLPGSLSFEVSRSNFAAAPTARVAYGMWDSCSALWSLRSCGARW